MKLSPWMIVGLVLAIFVGALGYVGVNQTLQTATGTLAGTITLYPIGPACVEKEECSRAAADQEVRLLNSENQIAESGKTNSEGKYKIDVKPGRYRVEAPVGRYGRGTKPSEPLTVSEGQTTHYDITIDTAIR